MSDKILLAESLSDQQGYLEWAELLYPIYRANYEIFHQYDCHCQNDAERLTLLARAKTKDHFHPDVIDALTILASSSHSEVEIAA